MPAASASLTATTRQTRGRAHDGLDVGTDPARVDVGCRLCDTALHDGGERAAERALPAEMAYDLGHHVSHRPGGRRLGGEDLVAFGGQLSDIEVYDSALDPRAADVDPKAERAHTAILQGRLTSQRDRSSDASRCRV